MMRLAALLLVLALPAAASDRCAPPAELGQVFAPPAPCFRMGAAFDMPTDRYAHAVLGDAIEWGGLVAYQEHMEARLDLPESRVFEDLAPRIADLGGDQRPEILVIESDARRGAMLVVYRAQFVDGLAPTLRRIAATDPIGTRFRWLAPAGIADFDGDGQNDIAYVETPHLAKVLRIVTLRGDRLEEIASTPGFTNHRIGEAFITGGVRDCGAGPELILADATWSRIMALRLEGDALQARPLGPFTGRESMTPHLECRE